MTIVNKAPPKWYEAWFRTEISSFTLGISFIWISVFVAEQIFAIAPGLGLQPDSHTNIALGGLDMTSIARGQIWRFFSNPFLHGGPNHLQWDVLALLSVGPTFQALVGRWWFAAVFALIALGSGAVFLLMNPEYPGTIGPMGVVMGLLAANFVCGFHFAEKNLRFRIWQASGASLVVALIETFRPQGFPVDISGHISCTIIGALLGCGLIVSWPQDKPTPNFDGAARLISFLFAFGSIVGFTAVVFLHPYYIRKQAETIPTATLLANPKNTSASSEEYIVRYPLDPWAHLLRGIYLFSQKDFPGAESEARIGLKLTAKSPFGPQFVDHERALLALALWQQGRITDAEDAVAPSCYSKKTDPWLRNAIQILRDGLICGR